MAVSMMPPDPNDFADYGSFQNAYIDYLGKMQQANAGAAGNTFAAVPPSAQTDDFTQAPGDATYRTPEVPGSRTPYPSGTLADVLGTSTGTTHSQPDSFAPQAQAPIQKRDYQFGNSHQQPIVNGAPDEWFVPRGSSQSQPAPSTQPPAPAPQAQPSDSTFVRGQPKVTTMPRGDLDTFLRRKS